jgi:hypothetical protein
LRKVGIEAGMLEGDAEELAEAEQQHDQPRVGHEGADGDLDGVVAKLGDVFAELGLGESDFLPHQRGGFIAQLAQQGGKRGRGSIGIHDASASA